MNVDDIKRMAEAVNSIKNPRSMVFDPVYWLTDKEYNRRQNKMYQNIRPTYGKALIIDEFGSFYVPSNSISSFIEHPLKDLSSNFNRSVSNSANDYYNENLQSVLYEDPEELEFGGYSPLTDTAIYYFVEDYYEYDDDLVYDSEDEDEDEDDEDVLDADGLDFWAFCDTLGIRLKPIDCLPEE